MGSKGTVVLMPATVTTVTTTAGSSVADTDTFPTTTTDTLTPTLTTPTTAGSLNVAAVQRLSDLQWMDVMRACQRVSADHEATRDHAQLLRQWKRTLLLRDKVRL